MRQRHQRESESEVSNIVLSNDTPKRIELHSTWHMHHGPDAKVVFFSIFCADRYEAGASMTVAEARQFGQMLIDEANRIERIGGKS